jgi:hypothetical protein
MALVHEQTIPTKRPLFFLAKLVVTSTNRGVSCGQRNRSPWPYSRISNNILNADMKHMHFLWVYFSDITEYSVIQTWCNLV